MSVNKVILLGNVGQDPKVKYFDSGSAVATFSLATTDRAYTLANGTQVPERTEWHNIVASNRWAEIVDKYLHKGDKLYVEGKLRTRTYTAQACATRYVTEVYVDYFEMLTPKSGSSGGILPTSSVQQPVNQSQIQQTQQSQTAPIQNNPADDLPF